jgi:hypothetical protein
MEILLAVLIGGCAVAGVYALRRRRRRSRGEAATPPPVQERGLGELRPDDVVIVDGRDWIVKGVARLTEGLDSWIEARLADGGEERWLIVRPDDPDAVLYGTPGADPGVGENPSESLDDRGKVLRLRRHGRAEVKPTGDLGDHFPEGECGYWDYDRPGEDCAWIRGGGQRWIYVFGDRIGRHMTRFLPGG